MDYARLRAAALQDGGEEAVTVDTRALIDKVLARYSGEWTTLRELIQNAADAQATAVKIKWETLPSTQVPLPATTDRSEHLKHVITHHTLGRLVVENNGQPFTSTDWGRLKRIAEGNPDETKIGAFGVGFYSVFADCEEPLVSSGNEAMAFYWKGNALFTRKLHMTPEQGSPNTAFILEYRNRTTPIPNLLSIGQFLATSLTFVALQKIEFWIDDWRLLSLQKKSSPAANIPIPRDLETTTAEGLMTLASADRMSTQIDATFMSVLGWKPKPAVSSVKNNDPYHSNAHGSNMPSLRSFFSRLTSNTALESARSKAHKEEKAAQDEIAEDVTATSNSSIFLRVTTAQVTTKVSSSFAAELQRATKKPPPKTTKIALLTSSYDETVASEESSAGSLTAKHVDVFSTVLPSKKPGGRIFIGFPTTQTTGAGMHISAQSVIPTVEREAIDLNARWVRTWNVEMLRVAGIVSRLGFSNDMADLQAKLERMSNDSSKKGSKVNPADVAKCIPEALHILKTYTFGDSTPSNQVGNILEEAFWTSHKRASIEVFSSQGVLSTNQVRLSSEELGQFVSGIPVILKEMRDAPFVQQLINFTLVRDITVDDIWKELESKALDKDQLRHFIAWIAKGAASGELDPPSRHRLLEVAVATISDGGDSGGIITLGSIKHFLGQNIPATLPIPPTTMPVAFTTNIPVVHLKALGWEQLGIVSWLRFLVESGSGKGEEWDLAKSSDFATRVLTVLSKSWDNLGPEAKHSVVSILQNITVMPTKVGMRKPGESFFPSVKLFDDLPTIQVAVNLKEKFLASLGVRKTVDLDTIFTRLLSPSPTRDGSGHKKWSHMELIKYLASVKDDIPATDMKKLRESQLCPAEAGPSGMESTKSTERLYKVSELYEPKSELRVLGLPLLQWPGPPGSFRSGSSEAEFLRTLGLQRYPTVPVLIDMMASPDALVRVNAMKYYVANHQLNGYATFNIASTNKAILPLEGNLTKLVPPSQCYTNERAAVLGYNILHKQLHAHASKFGVVPDPPMSGCVERLLASPPRDQNSAATVFLYFATRVADLGQNHIAKLKDAPIVPVTRGGEKGSSAQTYIRPQHCYLGRSTTYGDIFDFVDFGNDANLFLLKCGAKMEPSKSEIAYRACGEPARLLSVMQSPEKYLSLLRTLYEDLSTLKRDKELLKKMRTAPWLLGFRELSSGKETADAREEDEAPMRQYQLATASEIVILDDIISYRHFKQALLCAPEDDSLEEFYMALGSETLGSRVDEQVLPGSPSPKQGEAERLRAHVIERSKIFLYEYSKYHRDAVRRDERWLEKNMQVVMVRSLALRRSLKGSGKSHTEKRSSASVRVGDSYILYASAEGQVDLYQVGQALCQLILRRPGQQAYNMIEPFLMLDLYGLKARGYNVDRILRAQAAKARIAEEERRKALEAEQQAIRQRQEEFNRQRTTEGARQDVRTPEPKMPGSFDDSPETGPSHGTDGNKTARGGFFSNLSRRLGLEPEEEPNRPTSKPLPPPAEAATGSGSNPQQKGKAKGSDDGRVTNPGAIQQNLLNAIKSTRAHDSSHLFSPPTQTEVKEQGTYCDSVAGQNVTFAAEAPGGMRVFVAKDMSMSTHDFLVAHAAEIKQFEGILRDVCAVYGLPTKTVHIFFDEAGPTIAFNRAGSIFCNLRYFNQLHAARMRGADAVEGKVEAATYWWVTVAHELAHNLEPLHNSDHGFYTESFVQMYLGKMTAKIAEFRAATATTTMTTVAAGVSAAANGTPQQQPLPPPPPYSEYRPFA